MYNTKYEDGVLICAIHETPISKSHGRFFCLKCQRNTSKAKFTDLIEEISQVPIISGSRDIGWLIKKTDGKQVTLPSGTPYQTAVKIANAIASTI